MKAKGIMEDKLDRINQVFPKLLILIKGKHAEDVYVRLLIGLFVCSQIMKKPQCFRKRTKIVTAKIWLH